MLDATSILVDKTFIKNDVSEIVDRDLSSLSISTKKAFTKKGEEVAMTYNRQVLESYSLLEQFGFVVENNIFASLVLSVSNAQSQLTA